MNTQPEEKPFIRVNCLQDIGKDMTEESVTRQFNPTIQTYLYFTTVSLALCLLAALGIIVVLVLQQTGSAAQCDGQQRADMSKETVSFRTMASEKAAAYLQVSRPISQPRLRWYKEGILHNFLYDNGTLVVQEPGMYFIYCHLQFHIPKCRSNETELKLSLLVNRRAMKETVLTLCSSHQTSEGINHDISSILLVELKKGYRIEVEVNLFQYLDIDTLPSSNVLGALKYTGEDWKCPFLGAIDGQCL